MHYDIGKGPQRFLAYVEPSVEEMYNGHPPASTKVVPKFQGFSTKFINMSNQRLQLHWVPSNGGNPSPMSVMMPFHHAGTSSFPGHEFIWTDPENVNTVYHRSVIRSWPDNLQVYDPYRENPEALEQLTPDQRRQYEHLRTTLEFSRQYEAFTGRPYLADYLRNPPNQFLWPAEYFGQQHWVETYETHFTKMPSQSYLSAMQAGQRNLALEEYRAPSKLNMTLTVLSVAPRIFEIQNFLSPIEIQHILEIAGATELSRSTVGNVEKDSLGAQKREVQSNTRTSTNSWVERTRSPLIDAVYRRAANLMQMDEALLRDRGEDEVEHYGSRRSIAEDLQLVHYNPGQEYVAHHDFGYRDLKSPGQKARFATLLFYLNDEGLQGGATTFPRWRNAETFLPLKVTPQAGKAVLFYSQLPDGNFDDFSQHSAEKPRAGEKWLINLWTWAPYKE